MSKQVSRDVNKARYVVAAIMTLCIFLLGLMLGLIIEDKRIRLMQADNEDQQLEFSSMQMQYEYINQLSLENNCPAILKTFDDNLKNLEQSRIRLEHYEKDSKISKVDFNRIKRDYTIAQVRYWLFAKKKKQICDSDDISLLYFFAEDKSCPDCNKQSFVLSYIKNIFGSDLLIFSLNANFTQEPMIDMLKKSYNISEYPTMIINDMQVSGLHDKEDVLAIICPLYSNESVGCREYYKVLEESAEEI